jgi:hypothetical protein
MSMLLLFGGSSSELDLGTFDGASEIGGPYYVGTPQGGTFDLASFDGAVPIPGLTVLRQAAGAPVPGVPSPGFPVYPAVGNNPPPGDFQPQMYAELWSRTGTFISALETQSGVRFQDVLNDTGSGSLQIQLDDDDAALLVPGTEIRCYMFGQVAFTWEILQNPRIALHAEGEEAARTKSVAGQGRPILLDKAKVYPARGVENTVNAQHRLYTFASPDFPRRNTWGQAVSIVRAGTLFPTRAVLIEYTGVFDGEEDIVESLYVPAPNGWPIPDAEWIWGQTDTTVVGDNYFLKDFYIGSTENIAIIASGDNYYSLYLDGTPIIGDDELVHTWKDYKRVDLKLTAGWHTFGMIGVNVEWPPEYQNPAAVIAAVCRLDQDGEILSPAIIQTDATWRALPYPPVVPGWTPGEVMIDAIEEAQERGSLAGFSYDFTAANDSLGNPWPTMEGFSVPVGASLLDMLNGLVDEGWIDWRVKPGGKLLQMFNQGAIAQNSAITYEATGDLSTSEIVSQDFVPQVDVINRYLVKWTSGYFEIEDTASQAQWGEYEGFMTIDAPSVDEAQREAQVVLDSTSQPIFAVVCQVDPSDPARFPYEAYSVGQKVRVADPNGGLTWYQVQSITVSQTELARVDVALELNARLNTQQREDFDLLQGLGKTLVGDTKLRNQRMMTSDGKPA